jgi:hypothetical protein
MQAIIATDKNNAGKKTHFSILAFFSNEIISKTPDLVFPASFFKQFLPSKAT